MIWGQTRHITGLRQIGGFLFAGVAQVEEQRSRKAQREVSTISAGPKFCAAARRQERTCSRRGCVGWNGSTAPVSPTPGRRIDLPKGALKAQIGIESDPHKNVVEMWARSSNGKTPVSHSGVDGSIPSVSTKSYMSGCGVAAAHMPWEHDHEGSSPSTQTKILGVVGESGLCIQQSR